MKIASKSVDAMSSLEKLLEPRVNQALSRAITFNDLEINKVQNWLLKVKPKTIAERDFIKNVSYDLTRIRRGDKIVKLSLIPDMNVTMGVNEEGYNCYGVSLRTVETLVQKLLLNSKQIGRIASYEEAEFFRAYKIVTKRVSLETICTSGQALDNPREFYRSSTNGYSFAGGRGHSFVYEYCVKNGSISILPGDSIVIAIKNGD